MKASCVRYLQAHDEKASRQKSPREREGDGECAKEKKRGREARVETETVALENIYSESD